MQKHISELTKEVRNKLVLPSTVLQLYSKDYKTNKCNEEAQRCLQKIERLLFDIDDAVEILVNDLIDGAK